MFLDENGLMQVVAPPPRVQDAAQQGGVQPAENTTSATDIAREPARAVVSSGARIRTGVATNEKAQVKLVEVQYLSFI